MHDMIRCKNNFGEVVEIPCEKFFFRPSVYGFIVQDDRVLVMQNRSNEKLWFPGGGIEVHERLEEALKREIDEETGLKVEIGELLLTKENFFYYQPLDEAMHAFLFFYACHPLTNELISDELVEDLESKNPRWVPIDSIRQEDISDIQADIFKVLHQLKIEHNLNGQKKNIQFSNPQF